MKTKSLLSCMLVMIMVCMLSVSISSCGGDDDVDSDSGQTIKPETKVDDPTGTITLAMRNSDNGATHLDNIYIDKENFRGAYFVSLGPVKGLGNVSNIPTTGWAEQMAVIAGNGYVSYSPSTNQFYRIYVVADIISTTGGVIGADVKYQKPFKGKDEAIKLDETALAFEADGGTQTLTFTNTSIIPFTYESSEDWCHVYTSSTNTANIPNGIAIQVDSHNAAKATEATVKLTTLYGRETIVKVVRSAQAPYITVEPTEQYFGSEAQTSYFSVAGNIDIDKLTVSTDQTWCTATIEDWSDEMYAKAQKVLFVDDQPSSRVGFENNDARSYRLTVNMTKNYDDDQREAFVTIKSTDGKASAVLHIFQYGAYNYLSFESSFLDISVDGGTQSLPYRTSLPIDELVVKSDASWCQVELDETTNSVIATYEANTTSETREATITLSSKSGKRTTSTKLMQQTAYLIVSKNLINFDKNRNNITLTLSTNKTEWEAISSDESWCTFSTNGNQITIRTTAATEDRTATITFKNFDTTIKIHQSKYAEGDSYNENGLEGRVTYIGDKGRWIMKDLGEAQWSTENVLTGANSVSDGEYNMNVIKKIPGWEELYPAFKLVDDLNTNGITGWIFPAAGRNDLGQLIYTPYGHSPWSSTESTTKYAYGYLAASSSGMPSGIGTSNKTIARPVYAIHSF